MYPSYRLLALLRTALHPPNRCSSASELSAVGAVTKSSGQTELGRIEQSQEEALLALILSTLSAGMLGAVLS